MSLVNPPENTNDSSVYKTGEKPGPGIYRCVQNPKWVVTLEEGDELPRCGKAPDSPQVTYRKVVDNTDATTPRD